MPMDWNPLAEGDKFDADSLNERFTAIHGEINDLPSSSVEAESLSREHLPSPIARYGKVNDSSDYYFSSGRGEEGYMFPGWPVHSSHPEAGSAWFDPGLTDVRGVTPSSGSPDLYTGWKVIDEIDFGDGFAFTASAGNAGSNAVSSSIEKVNGILVLANIYVEELYVKNTKNSVAANVQAKLLAAIALTTDSGATFIAPVTIRYLDSETNTNNSHDVSVNEADHFHIPRDTSENPAQRQVHALQRIHKDLPIRSYITQNDIKLSVGTYPVWKYVRLLACLDNHSQTYRHDDWKTTAKIGHSTLSVIMPKAEHITNQTDYWFTEGS